MENSYSKIVNGCAYYKSYVEAKDLDDVAEQIKDRIMIEMKREGFDEEEMAEFDWFQELVDKVIKVDRDTGSNKFTSLFPIKNGNRFNKMLDKLAELVIEKTNDELGLCDCSDESDDSE